MGSIPEDAVILFSGKDLSNWHARNGGPAAWEVADGVMTVSGGGDIVTDEKFTDFVLHLEWMEPDMPDAKGQAKGNSGVYLQGRYEIQVLDSYGIEVPGKGDCGAIYDVMAPTRNTCKPAGEWNTTLLTCDGNLITGVFELVIAFEFRAYRVAQLR